ncbi:helix-turn-helix domain-containing protein [Rhizobium puerariae]|uniref:Helix-turn-helix domain-containing protein n=1 Tax=Rhizobium puerariae TaxID=1585791 RepID=A0ABV6AGX2_9HYPH
MSLAAIGMNHELHHPIEIGDIDSLTSGRLSRLLLRALDCVERDETVALDLVKQASMLMRPHVEAVETRRTGDDAVSGGLAPWQARRVAQHIQDRISRSISLEELARLARLSTSYFSTAFKVSFGTSPHSYILAQRVDHAKRRMLATDAPLCEIALDCGLADQAHLCRVFRRATGTTPSAWRRYQAMEGGRSVLV